MEARYGLEYDEGGQQTITLLFGAENNVAAIANVIRSHPDIGKVCFSFVTRLWREDSLAIIADAIAANTNIQEIEYHVARTDQFHILAARASLHERTPFKLCFVYCQLEDEASASLFMGSINSLLEANALTALEFRLWPTSSPRVPTVELAGGLASNTSLRELQFFASAVSVDTLRSIAVLLCGNADIEKLDVTHLGLLRSPNDDISAIRSEEAAVLQIVQAARNHSSLSCLKLDWKHPERNHLESLLKHSPNLREFALHTDLNDSAVARQLADGLLKETCSIEKLDFRHECDEDIAEAGMITDLARVLRSSRTLKEILLRIGAIGGTGTSLLVSGLVENTTLENLTLRECNMGSEGASTFGRALELNTTLCNLTITQETDSAGRNALAHHFPRMHGLQSLTFETKQDFQTDEAANAFVTSLKQNTSLEEVTLFETRDEDKFPRAASIMPQINALVERNSDLNQAGWPILRPMDGPAYIFGCYLGRSSENVDFIYHILREKNDILLRNYRRPTRTNQRKRRRLS